MEYLYYPGCSLQGLSMSYDESLKEVFKVLDIGLIELPDWNCCGATSYMSVDELAAFALASRNLAIAERFNNTEGKGKLDVLAPCASCYLVLMKANDYLGKYEEIGTKVRKALAAANLEYNGTVTIRHPLDTLVNDYGLENLKFKVTNPLKGLRVACYYGCQIVRPYATFDDQHHPHTMNDIVEAMGATTVQWPLKTRCCGGSLTATIEDIGYRLNYILLKTAEEYGADVIASACPLCQFNLDSFQDRVIQKFNGIKKIPVVYFTQLMGLAYGIDETKLGLQRHFVKMQPLPAGSSGGNYVRV